MNLPLPELNDFPCLHMFQQWVISYSNTSVVWTPFCPCFVPRGEANKWPQIREPPVTNQKISRETAKLTSLLGGEKVLCMMWCDRVISYLHASLQNGKRNGMKSTIVFSANANARGLATDVISQSGSSSIVWCPTLMSTINSNTKMLIDNHEALVSVNATT